MRKYNRAMEIFWFITGVFTLIGVTYLVIDRGWESWGVYYMAPAIAFSMAFGRWFVRKRLEKIESIKKDETRDEKNGTSD